MDYKEHFHSLIDLGNYEDAFTYLKKFKGYAYEEPFYFANMGWMYNQFHDYENAKSYLLTGLRVFEKDGWMYAQLGCTYNRCMEYDKALDCFYHALDLEFDESWIHYEMCIAHRERKEYEEAYEEIENALLDVPDHLGYMEECGDLLITMEQYAKAKEIYEKAFALSNEPYYQLMIAQCLEKDARYEEALSLYEKIHAEELRSEIALHKGICQYYLQQYEQARSDLNDAHLLGRDDTLLYQYMGRVYQSLDQNEQAELCFQRALTYYQRAFDNYEDRRWLYQEMIDVASLMQDPSHLLDIVEKGLHEYGGEAWIRYQAARAYSDVQQYDQSIPIIQNTDASIYSDEFDYLLAHDLGRARRQSEAIAVLEKLLHAHPNDTWILCEYGWNLAGMEYYEAAVKMFQKALAIEEDPYCEAMIGWCYYQLEQQDKAIAYLKKAEELGFDQKWLIPLCQDCEEKQKAEVK